VLVDAATKQILATAHAKGPKHDYSLFKEHDPHLKPDVWYVADSGYQGLQASHPQTCLPVKKSRGKALSSKDQQHNRALGRFRVSVEHVIRRLKVWRILKETYRNRRKRFALRFKLIAALVNAELDL